MYREGLGVTQDSNREKYWNTEAAKNNPNFFVKNNAHQR
ncbi:hypothetical protein GOV09_00990 [Candidatus Woesearchaeota archaeon]|nr:hypothetical protein [Candidatus Woesearchaeota archaeon]